MNDFRPNKNLGQHFLHGQSVLNKLSASLGEAQAIVEIGPGSGHLTRHLVQRECPLKVVEKDRHFEKALTAIVGGDCVYLQDALEFDLEAHFEHWGWSGQKIGLASNLPYNAATPLLAKFLACPSITFMALMFQREVAKKIEGQGGMNSLAALAQTYFTVERLCRVPPGAFHPPPRVESTALFFRRRELVATPLPPFAPYQDFLRQLFRFRRKQVGNVLSDLLPADRIGPALEELGISPSRRAETFQLREVQLLYRKIYEYQNH